MPVAAVDGRIKDPRPQFLLPPFVLCPATAGTVHLHASSWILTWSTSSSCFSRQNSFATPRQELSSSTSPRAANTSVSLNARCPLNSEASPLSPVRVYILNLQLHAVVCGKRFSGRACGEAAKKVLSSLLQALHAWQRAVQQHSQSSKGI